MKSARVISEKSLYSGNYIALKLVTYEAEDGCVRNWEAAVRNPPTSAVMILPLIVPDDEVVILRQFRPPTGTYVWETPAGLIDPGEDPGEDPGAAALRELAEETGFTGKLLKVLPPSLSTAGMSGESVYMAFVEIDGTLYPPERQLQTDFDESENIVTYRVKRSELNKFLLDAVSRGDAVDSKLLLYSEIFRAGGAADSSIK